MIILVLIVITISGCSFINDDVIWDTDVPESESIDASMGTWDPTGTSIVFQYSGPTSSGNEANNFLWSVNVQDNRITSIFDAPVLYADVSSDGNNVIFSSPTLPQYLYTYDKADGSLMRLSGESSPNPNMHYTVFGQWNPAGDRILFTIVAGEPRGLYIMNRDGSDAHIVVPYALNGSWSPDGQKIIYVNWDLTESDDTRRKQIYLCNPDGTSIQKLTNLNNSEVISGPTISPDGKRIAFVHMKRGDSPEIYLMDIDGTNISKITDGDGYVDRPTWHPDGSRILFTRVIPNVSNRLYYVDMDTYSVEPVFPKQ